MKSTKHVSCHKNLLGCCACFSELKCKCISLYAGFSLKMQPNHFSYFFLFYPVSVSWLDICKCNCLLQTIWVHPVLSFMIQPLQKIQNFALQDLFCWYGTCHHHSTPLLEELHCGFPIWFQNILINSFKLCQIQPSDTLTDCWSCIVSGLPMDGCNFTWQHENTRDTNQAVNGSLSIFLCVPFLELLMQQFGLVLWHFFHHMCTGPTGALSSKQNGDIQAKVRFELH